MKSIAAALSLTIWPLLSVGETVGTGIRILSSDFGVISYGTSRSVTDFSVKPTKEIGASVRNYAWIIYADCPRDGEWVEWTELTHMPGPDRNAKPGISEEDPTITVAPDLKSFTTRRGSPCKNGKVRIDDVYGREDGEPLGQWRIEVLIGGQRMARFEYVVTEHVRP
jgi:hypothetical protein